MADEFMKGFAILVTAGLGWLTLAGWYTTAGFEATQLYAPNPAADTLTMLDQFAIVLKAGFWVFAVSGPLVFWVLIPAAREFRRSRTSQ